MIKESILDLLRPVLARTGSTGRDAIRVIESLKYMDRRVWDNEWGNQKLCESVTLGKPQAIGKLGSGELLVLRRYIRYRTSPNATILTARDRKSIGLYPDNPDALERYFRLMTDDVLQEMTMVGVWFNLGEADIIKKYAKKAIRIPMTSLESYGVKKDPWTKALRGKTVIVISPFIKTIKAQYERRMEIWEGRENILPEFNLKLIKAPYHVSLVPPTHTDWFAELENLKSQMSAVNFDIALIGAAAFSLPLAVYAKKLGKQGIHLGGATQVYFGIKGKRWEKIPAISRLYNNFWIRPFPEEVPSNTNIVEGGAYW